MVEKNLDLLEQNLEKKNGVLDCLLEVCDKQTVLLKSPSVELEAFDGCMEEQDKGVQELILLNDEAEDLYEQLRSENLLINGPYGEQIKRLRALISQIMDKTSLLQEKEQSNKQRMEAYFQMERKSFGTGRRSSKAALDYYRNMNRSNVIPPQFMDQKK